MRLRTAVGAIELTVSYGQDPEDQHWGCPLREEWGMGPNQTLSPLLQDRLCFTVTATGSYEEAAAVAGKWGVTVDDSVLHALVRRKGARAEELTEKRLAQPPSESEPKRAAVDPLVLMLDGFQVRHRGVDWGASVRRKKAVRVEWHELKTGVIYRHDQAGRSAGGRGVLTEKAVVSWQGDAMELGRRVHWEARERGLGRAKNVLVVADGAAWIGNLVADRWSGATEVLDFYHASQHLWTLGEALHGESGAAGWVEPRLHQLRHGKEAEVVAEMGRERIPRGERGEVVRREANYFQTQVGRMDYRRVSARGWPIGSGAVESACRRKQCRFKRSGQFWTRRGLRHLCALEAARYNDRWDALWAVDSRGQR
jgi:hypothetical protein